MLVVERSLVVVDEDFVGLRDEFEFDVGLFAFFFGDFVGMVGESSLSRLLVSLRV